MNSIGYARISTSGQTLDAQLEQLEQLGTAGCDPVFKETMSGARSDRPELRKALAILSEGDVLMVTRLDRLAGQRVIFWISSTRSKPRARS